MYGVEYAFYDKFGCPGGVFYAIFEPLTRGSTVRRIRRGRGTPGEGWQMGVPIADEGPAIEGGHLS